MKRLLLLLTALSMTFMYVGVSFADDATTVKGYVTDSKCGVKGANAKASDCSKKCLKAGTAKMVVVTDESQKILTVENPDALTDHIGHHVAVTGKVTGDSIHVDNVSML